VVGTPIADGRTPVTTTALTRTPTSGRSELLLVSTLPAFVAYLVVAVLTVATKAESSSGELTPGDLSDLGASWLVVHVLWMAPSVLAVLGLTRLAPRAGDRAAVVVQRCLVVTLGLATLYMVPQVAAYTVDAETWGDSPWYAAGVALSLAVGWLGTIPATLVVALGLARRGVVPRSAYAVVALCALYLAWEVATYAAVALGSPTLLDTVGPPPFLLGVLWAFLGALLWWSGRREGAVA
jgi:hypothetical protein